MSTTGAPRDAAAGPSRDTDAETNAAAAAAARDAADAADTATAKRAFFLGLLCLPWLHVVLLLRFRARLGDASALGWYLRASAAAALAMTALLCAWVAGAQAARVHGLLSPAFFVFAETADWWAATG